MKTNHQLDTMLAMFWAALVCLFLCVSACEPSTAPVTIRTIPAVPYTYKCEVIRQAAYNHLKRCEGEISNVCIPPQLLEPCTRAVYVNEESYARCLTFLTEMRSCSYVAFGCDWSDIFEFTPVKSRDMPIDTPVQKCEALAQRTRERGLAITSMSDAVICTDPERLLPCSQATGVSDGWGECFLRLVTAGGGEKACPQRGMVTFAD